MAGYSPKEPNFGSPEQLKVHYERHKNEYPGFTMEDYSNRAKELALDENVLSYKRRDVEVVKYDEDKNDYLVMRNNGRIKTMFRPKEGKEYYDDKKSEEE